MHFILICMAASLCGQQTGFNYGEALQKSILFYEAQRSGPLPASNRIDWRGDSGLRDGEAEGVDLTGGWHDAGDHVKFGFPMASSATLLAWGVLEYPEGYRRSGQLDAILDNLRWVNDYFLKASAKPDELWAQVGDGQADHAWWGPAEVMAMPRPAFRITKECPGSDLAGETAAALAASALVFERHGDGKADLKYAGRLRERARDLYRFADQYRGRYSDCVTAAAAFYRSWSGYDDELAWSAAWLYRSTGEEAYLEAARGHYQRLNREAGTEVKAHRWTHGWDDKSYGAYVLMAQLTGEPEYRADAERWLDFWTTGYQGTRIRYTPGGLAWLDQWGSLRYAANTALLAFIYGVWLHAGRRDEARAARYRAFAARQIDYMLGDNPARRSYVIGFGQNPPRNPHHRTAHGSWADSLQTPVETTHTLYGALVGGPGINDDYEDRRTDFVGNEVATDYNAAFTGALARLYTERGGDPIEAFPAPSLRTRDEFMAEAALNARGADFVEIAAVVHNRSAWPARQPGTFALRYFFTLDEGGAEAIRLSAAHNDCEAPAGPFLWSERVFFVEIDCSGRRFAPAGQSASRLLAQFRIAGRPGWDPARDWSGEGLPEPGSPAATAARIALYEDGALVWGEEPPGASQQPLEVMAPAVLPPAKAGEAYSFRLRARGGTAPYRQWEIAGGALPEGIELSDAGLLGGTPRREEVAEFTVRVTDDRGETALAESRLVVEPGLPLTLAGGALPDGLVDRPYEARISPQGGVAPYSWTVAGGGTPPGLDFGDGVLAGKPEAAGEWTWTLRVTDSVGAVAEAIFTFRASAQPPPGATVLTLLYRTHFTEIRSNQIGPQFLLVNGGTESVPLAELSVRYYFTPGSAGPLQHWCDYAVLGCEKVVSRFVMLEGGRAYLENTFTGEAGLLEPGRDTGEWQNRFAREDWSPFNQSGDYSFDPSRREFEAWERVTVHRNGVLVWGQPPEW